MHAARCFPFFLGLWLAAGCRPHPDGTARKDASAVAAGTFAGSTAGQERTVAGIALCWCPAGTFLMGSPPEEPGRRPDEQQVTVTLSRGFWMGKYEITQAEWKALSTIDESTLLAGKGDRFPIYGVSYDELPCSAPR